ncbi:hypothetical protein GcM1_233022 [Golovinomyces cichoracearum]|uniref:C2H2-type domain-containing protein n=1 Tax=Golovinomyces cichoracearum TaxID=62708 RepID=A0A420ILQ0_9PEZI|nr:hypothetical protein GcM1_233022 [Golovinomyces cichoracearum]
MSCVETQIRSSLTLDTGKGLQPRIIQRKNPSQSSFLNNQKNRFSSETSSNFTADASIIQCHQTSQARPDRLLRSLSPDGTMTSGNFERNRKSTQDSSISNEFPNSWNSAITHFENKLTSPFLTQDSTENSSFNPVCSYTFVYMQPGQSDCEVMYNDTNSCDLHGFTELQNLDCHEFSLEGDAQYQDKFIDTTCFPNPKLYDLGDSTEDDSFTGLNFGQILSTDSTAFSNTPSTEYSNWENLNLTGSPGLLPLYDEWNLSPVTNSPVCFSSPVHVSSPGQTEIYLDVQDQPDQSITDGSRTKEIGNVQTGLNDTLGVSGSSSTTEIFQSDDLFKQLGRSSIEIEGNAREHPLYHNVSPGEDGLYHCPWENEPGSNCQHRPEKLKCNYDKFVDSHLKPFRCKVPACKNLHFSSTACLLRHEREAHAMHGHGDKPFLCIYEGCERGTRGNGFPRHWNLRDHMKRVHNDTGYSKSNASVTSHSTAPIKGRKRKVYDTSQVINKKFLMSYDFNRSKEPSLIERYKKKQQTLLDIVKQLQDPGHKDNVKLLCDANDCIKVMAQTTQRIISAPNMAKQAG